MFFVPIIFGLPLHLWLGMLLFLMVLFQVLTGSRLLRLRLVWHRVIGYTILVIAVIHGTLGAGIWFRLFRIG